ncbi:hypothetical protein TSAR_007925 [Trichomalopsis sarcophagae]|uniref:Uncharacterized protein n=1 Tax=Trichomalopsis sarcophagae TaxID=543379 RepID=A0A232FB80_9HYME|nr:hypothetical protein TSAR_007925 [Trichomalopsis sarcophagae]
MKNQLSESKSSLEKRMTAIEKSLEPLKEIPVLINRDVAALRAEQEEIKSKLEQLLISGAGSSSSPSNAPALCTEIIQQLREVNTRIQVQLDSVASFQAKLSAELVITGLTFSETTSLRHLAYATLWPLDAELTERDIISVRPLGRMRVARNDTVDASGASPGAASLPLSVSLSRTLMHSLISAKIKIRKLQTTQLSSKLLHKARFALPFRIRSSTSTNGCCLMSFGFAQL